MLIIEQLVPEKITTHIDKDLKLKKIGIIHWWTFANREAETVEQVIKFVEDKDLILFYSEEFIDIHLEKLNDLDLFKKLNSYNTYYIVLSESNRINTFPNSQKLLSFPWFAKELIYSMESFYTDLDYRPKNYTFNMLLGSERPWRTKMFTKLFPNPQIYFSYLGHPRFKKISNTEFEEEDIKKTLVGQDIESKPLDTHYMARLPREGVHYAISRILPHNIYRHTHFDIVTETNIDDGVGFTSEKIGKPLKAGRFFCGLFPINTTKYLEKFGFSFNTYMAMYDTINYGDGKIDAVSKLINGIINSDIEQIYKKTKEERSHNQENYNKIRSNFKYKTIDWLENIVNDLEVAGFLYSLLNQNRRDQFNEYYERDFKCLIQHRL